MNAGKILQNAILINKLTPKNQNASDSYVLIGAAKNKHNEPFIAVLAANSLSNEIAAINVMDSANTKKSRLCKTHLRLREARYALPTLQSV